MSYDLLATFYDAFIDSAVYNEYLRLLDKYTSRGSLLDIGCGTGSLSLKLAKQGFNVTATDLSEEMLSIVTIARKKTRSISTSLSMTCSTRSPSGSTRSSLRWMS